MVILSLYYRKFSIAIPIMITSISEIFLTLALAALIGWNIDLAGIAGIILAVGTGVNDQIVITDEAIRKEAGMIYNWKERIKRAFFIVFSAYTTTTIAMLPLLFAGAGLLKGFAITTILALSIGVFVTRPAFGAVVQYLLE
jgi:preprotein translocase subunit SecD